MRQGLALVIGTLGGDAELGMSAARVPRPAEARPPRATGNSARQAKTARQPHFVTGSPAWWHDMVLAASGPAGDSVAQLAGFPC